MQCQLKFTTTDFIINNDLVRIKLLFSAEVLHIFTGFLDLICLVWIFMDLFPAFFNIQKVEKCVDLLKNLLLQQYHLFMAVRINMLCETSIVFIAYLAISMVWIRDLLHQIIIMLHLNIAIKLQMSNPIFLIFEFSLHYYSIELFPQEVQLILVHYWTKSIWCLR